MRNAIIIFSVVLFAVPLGYAQRAKSALLPVSEASALAKQCSRESPSDFTETWIPTVEQIRKMESKLGDISKLRAKCCIEGEQIERPQDWYMQYVGLVYRGKKVIYISAVDTDEPRSFISKIVNGNEVVSETQLTWKMRAIVICDGGNAWGVIYDVESGNFSDLSVNGIG